MSTKVENYRVIPPLWLPITISPCDRSYLAKFQKLFSSSSFSTCFYVLGLLASTSIGADKLEELGWDCVRHKGSDIWPIIEHEVTYYVEPEFSEDEEVSLRRSAYAHNGNKYFSSYILRE